MKALTAVVVLAMLTVAAPAEAAFQPENLHVVGGDGWHADRSFELRWFNPEGVAAVHYRVLTSSGQVAVTETTLKRPATAIEYLNVPPTPGAYTAEVWLEDSAGQLGSPASAKLRFDDVSPGPTEPPRLPAWIGRNDFPLTIRLGQPQGLQPLSGIRGYAYSVDRDPAGEPCAGARTCSEAEIDLPGGPEDNATSVPGLPEGRSYLHAVVVSGSGVRSATATVALDVDEDDPVTLLSGAAAGWSSQPVRLRADAVDSASGMTVGGEPFSPFTAIRIDGGSPVTGAGDSVSTTVIGSGVHRVEYYARDAAGNVADGAIVNGLQNPTPATALVRVDREPPHLAFAAAQNPLDPERIEAPATDSMSGFDPSRGRIGVRAVGSRQRFRELPTEASNGALRARWDSGSFPPGPYEFRVTAYDAAGNAASTVLRSNGTRMVLRAPLKVPTTLLARFLPSGALYAPIGSKRRTGRVWTVGYGRQVWFGGRLIAGRRTPLGGRTVGVIERFEPGVRPAERVSTAKTDADGRFALRLAPGPSREVVAVAPSSPTLAEARSDPAQLEVRGRLLLRVSSAVAKVGGRPIVFSGSVAGAPFPPDGKIVQLQFRLPGLPWSEFRTVRANARGRFRYAYRFADDDSRGARFRFRAFAPPQAGWPYGAAGSRPVTVEGR